ncbi:hypothetical protein [Paenibacillus glacialis]|uniref:Uncharacterized protein n=1 Tax=Paenibacillus glacialis TaxID=494026 RepID=A0A168NPH6_9BACL|nr:hypothetical protein [Paenibacillus glacialis]OAB46000.1 hypothetical protein PGLA_00965 [Paenibacillus glacialis]
MQFDVEIAEIVKRYLKETKDQDLSIAEILTRPRWKRVWFWWKALEYYEGKPMPELTIEEVKGTYGD